MEWALPRAYGPEAVRRVLDWVASERYPVAFPLECRVVAGDDALLSPSFDRDTFYIAVHQYRGMEWRPYFEAVQSIMDDYDGRPHWGKRHMLESDCAGDALPTVRRLSRGPRPARPRSAVQECVYGAVPRTVAESAR